jgi:hypothetical protein
VNLLSERASRRLYVSELSIVTGRSGARRPWTL